MNTLYFHGKTTDGNRFTIAGKSINKMIHLGISICSKKDNFVKSLGRVKAEGRIYANSDKGEVFVSKLKDETIGKSFLTACKYYQEYTKEGLSTLFNFPKYEETDKAIFD